MTTGVIVARFQVPYLTAGHIHLINEVWRRSEQILIILGCTNTPDQKNILSYEIRREMILESYPFAQITSIRDHREDAYWCHHLDAILSGSLNPTLYGSRDCFIKHYSGNYPFVEIEEVRGLSGTQLRAEMKVVNNSYYRLGLIHGFNLNKNG